LVWLVAFVATAGLATGLSYASYGAAFWEAAVLHHWQRADHRHNYAVWWYPLYLTFEGEGEGDGGSASSSSSVFCERGDADADEGRAGVGAAGWRRALGLAAMVPPLFFVLLAPAGLFRVRGTSADSGARSARSGSSGASSVAISGAVSSVVGSSAISGAGSVAISGAVSSVVGSSAGARGRSAVLAAQARRLPLCLFATTAVFVHANKVGGFAERAALSGAGVPRTRVPVAPTSLATPLLLRASA
jgi:hypothetical protein